MNNLQNQINNYLEYCQNQKRLDSKTLKAYRIDLKQFHSEISASETDQVTSEVLEKYIADLHQTYKPKTVKRKIASIKAFFRYLEYKEVVDKNPFNRIQIKFREPTILPKTIPLQIVETFLSTIYTQRSNAHTTYQKRNALRDAAVIELLFASVGNFRTIVSKILFYHLLNTLVIQRTFLCLVRCNQIYIGNYTTLYVIL